MPLQKETAGNNPVSGDEFSVHKPRGRNARPLRRAVQHLLENPLSNEIIAGKFKEGDILTVDAKEGKITFEKTGSVTTSPIPPSAEPEEKKKPKKK